MDTMNEIHAKLLIDSYRRWTGKHLIELNPMISTLTQLNEAEVAILSHGIERDPILNYGNYRAQALWEMDEEQFTNTPSRLTAEPMERDQRAEFLANVSEKGFVSNYRGIRISATGRRFYIQDATVWNIINEQGVYCGQGATFKHIQRIEE